MYIYIYTVENTAGKTHSNNNCNHTQRRCRSKSKDTPLVEYYKDH